MGSLLWSRGKWEYKAMISFFGKKGNTHSVKGRNEKPPDAGASGGFDIFAVANSIYGDAIRYSFASI
jgi:hypothetical protein